jgi:hypothetical protein
VTDQPRRPQYRPGSHAQRPLPAARRALTDLGGLLLALAGGAGVGPVTSATPAPPKPPVGPPPAPPPVTAPGLPLWAVLVILGGTITLSAATTLITLSLRSIWRRPQSPTRPLAPGEAPVRATSQAHRPRPHPPRRPPDDSPLLQHPRAHRARAPTLAQGPAGLPLVPGPADPIPAPISGPHPQAAAAHPHHRRLS